MTPISYILLCVFLLCSPCPTTTAWFILSCFAWTIAIAINPMCLSPHGPSTCIQISCCYQNYSLILQMWPEFWMNKTLQWLSAPMAIALKRETTPSPPPPPQIPVILGEVTVWNLELLFQCWLYVQANSFTATWLKEPCSFKPLSYAFCLDPLPLKVWLADWCGSGAVYYWFSVR